MPQRRRPPAPTVALNVRITQDLAEWLYAETLRLGMNRTEYVAQLLERERARQKSEGKEGG